MHVEPISRDDAARPPARDAASMGHDGARVYEHATLAARGASTREDLDAGPALRADAGRAQDPRAARRAATSTSSPSTAACTCDEGIPLLPPVVERSHEPDGRTVWLINDGIHRVYAAHLAGSPINVVAVDGAVAPVLRARAPPGTASVELEELPDGFREGLPRPGELQGAVPRLQRGVPGRPAGAEAVESRAPRALTRKRTVSAGSGPERDEVHVQVGDAAAVEAHVAAALDRRGRRAARAAP